jgi:hypothetical protein
LRGMKLSVVLGGLDSRRASVVELAFYALYNSPQLSRVKI